ncbi:hypothetical protein EDC01DRAFT_632356 [Geopyxis carbonaria]|nr:hypothetical protein EDC01DRAFT_632356 [Geopyxis carbonaria]
MRPNLTLVVFFVALLALASAARDKWCYPYTAAGAGAVHCRRNPSVNSAVVRIVENSDQFGVRCKKQAAAVQGNNIWDWVPGWKCWINAHYVRGSPRTCESMFLQTSGRRWSWWWRNDEIRFV